MADAEDLEGRGLIAHSYSSFFKIRKRMRKIQDISLPFRRGLGVEQFLTFLLVLVVMLVIYGTLLLPLMSFAGWNFNWQFYLVYFLAPAFLAASRAGKPMKSGKTIPGTVRSWLHKLLDDPVHRRGVPMRRRPVDGRRLHYARVWQAHPQLAPYLPPGATDPAQPVDGVDLDEWLGETLAEYRRADEQQKPQTDAEGEWRRRVRGTTDRVVLPHDYDDA
jgi:hypothetical protein